MSEQKVENSEVASDSREFATQVVLHGGAALVALAIVAAMAHSFGVSIV